MQDYLLCKFLVVAAVEFPADANLLCVLHLTYRGSGNATSDVDSGQPKLPAVLFLIITSSDILTVELFVVVSFWSYTASEY